jgi:hypothetical protein
MGGHLAGTEQRRGRKDPGDCQKAERIAPHHEPAALMTTEPVGMTISALDVTSIALIRQVPARGSTPDAFAVVPLPVIVQMIGSGMASLVHVTSPDLALLAIVSVSRP